MTLVQPLPSVSSEENQRYWDRYYVGRAAPETPTQFAAFVMSEMTERKAIIDCGCGSGRDSLFFAQSGKQVVGLDGSSEAVEHCRIEAVRRGLESASFERVRFGEDDPEQIVGLAENRVGAQPLIVYARFLLHALTDEQEGAFLQIARKLCRDRGLLAVEFRTHRDRHQVRVTAPHFRRYLDPMNFIASAHRSGFECRYHVEGFGYAKYKDDDAHVCRSLLCPV